MASHPKFTFTFSFGLRLDGTVPYNRYSYCGVNGSIMFEVRDDDLVINTMMPSSTNPYKITSEIRSA